MAHWAFAKGVMLELDHIAVFARTLEEGVDHVRDALGVEIPKGGAHPLMGTHNHLMRLDEDAFVEVIAIDPDGQAARPRWFGLDHFREPPRLGTWVLRGDVEQAMATSDCDFGPQIDVTRGNLKWRLTVPKDGSMPFDGAGPSLIEWGAGDRPGARMADFGCRLQRLVIRHPDAVRIRDALAPFLDDGRVEFETGALELIAEINTPAGLRELR